MLRFPGTLVSRLLPGRKFTLFAGAHWPGKHADNNERDLIAILQSTIQYYPRKEGKTYET